MQHYDTIQRTDDDVEMGSEFIPKRTDNVFTINGQSDEEQEDDDEEIDVDIHGDNEHKNGIFDDSAI